ncbi:protein rep [Nocardia testacea]|uniref:protein rep n=1 Tax=Nocardia testacea TaxID=248551 RepID=UPI00340D48D2
MSVRDGRKTAGFGGLETCGRIWLCPICASKIRVRRGDQIAEGVARHMANGGAAWFLTITLPHEKGDALKDSFDALTKAWQYVKNGKRYQEDKKRFGIIGDIKAVEVTHGENGWHPHAHILVLTSRGLEFDEMCAWVARLDARWAQGLAKVGWPTGRPGVRLTLLPVDKGKGIAAYVAKVQEKGLGNEIARADMKDAIQGNRTPFQILADFGNTGLADDLELWWEFEHATAGRSAIRWSPGLWAKLMPDEDQATDEQIAAEEMDGETVAVLTPWTWRRIAEIDGAEVMVLEAVEASGWEGLLRTLIRLRINASGVYTPEEWGTPNAVELEPL